MNKADVLDYVNRILDDSTEFVCDSHQSVQGVSKDGYMEYFATDDRIITIRCKLKTEDDKIKELLLSRGFIVSGTTFWHEQPPSCGLRFLFSLGKWTAYYGKSELPKSITTVAELTKVLEVFGV